MQKFGKSELSSRSAGMVLIPAVVAVVAMLLSRSGLSTVVCWDVAWTAAAICALAGMIVGRRHSQDKDRWTLWIVAAACWLAGQLAWDTFGLIGMPQSPNLADIGWWAYAVLVIVIMVRVHDRSLRLVAAAETLPLIASALALTFAELWHDASISALPLAARLSALVYPALYVVACVLTLQWMVGGSARTAHSPGSRLVLGGVAAQAVAFTLWSEQLLDQTYVTGRTLLDPLWVLGLLAIGAGAAMSMRQTPRATVAGEPSDRGGLLPAAMFMLLLAALVQARFTHAAAGAEIALAAGLTFSGLALIVRARLLERRLWVLLSRERAALTTLADREGELGRLNEQLVEDSRRDVLTGMRNRRAMSDDLPMLEARHQERGDSFALALCDIDHFKPYNDRLGHLAGDQALRAIAAAVRGALRAGDTAYRFGGEELLLVLGKANARDALAAAERVRAAVEEMMLPHPDGIDGRLTVSIGVAAGSGDAGRLLACADAALYEAKHLGRNRVAAATEATVPQAIRRSPPSTSEEPIPRQLRGMLTVSRAAVSGGGELPVLDALAKAIRSELSFQVVVVNLLDRERMELRVVAVLGDEEARQMLLDSVNPWSEWEALMESDHVRCGAIWLPAGSYDFSAATKLWTPAGAAGPNADSWQPEDMLLLPLRGASGEVLGVVSVDQPLTGCRPDDPELTLLMTVADHAGLALEQTQRDSASTAVREESQELRLAAMMLLAETVDLRDPDTARHSRTVGVYARETAAALGLPPDQLEPVHAAGVLHDLGKLGITDAILFKPGPLDEPEWSEIRRHPELGARILEHAGMTDIAGWVRAHHERLDGHGYPRGLLAGEIVLEARILAVADSYEAMVTDRPYHAGIEPAQACEELLRCAGTQFDLRVVEAFLNTLPRHSQPPGNRLVAAA